MSEVTFEQMQKVYEAERKKVLDNSTRGKSALHLAKMAIEHGGSGSRAAANVLLAAEYNDVGLNLIELVHLDPTNRAHADLVIMGIKGGDFLPSNWITGDTCEDGNELLLTVREKWPSLTSS
jgi:hypothetical protein